jgi:PAS domain S-box-containing protein
MKLLLDRNMLFGIGLIVALIVVNAGLGIRNAGEIGSQSGLVAHSQEVLDLAGNVMATALEAESSLRGYVATRRNEFLETYTTAVSKFEERLQALESETRDNVNQTERIQKIRKLSVQRLVLLQETLQTRRENAGVAFTDPQLIEGIQGGKRLMDEIREVMAEMRQAEQELLARREKNSLRAYQFAITSGVLGAGLALIMVIGFVRLLQRSLSLRNAAAAEVHEHRERLRTTLASIGDAVIATDLNGNVTFLNSVAQRLTGWTESDASGLPLTQIFHIVNAATREIVDNPALRALEEGCIVGLANHTILMAKDGTEWPIDDSAAPIRSESGEILGSVLIFRDITEQKRDEATRAEQSRLATLRAESSSALSRTSDLQSLLQHCAQVLVHHLDVAFSRIWILNDAEGVLELQASAGAETASDARYNRVEIGELEIGLIAQTRLPYFTNDAATDPALLEVGWTKREGIVSFAGFPLMIDDRVVGVLALFAHRALTQPETEDLRLIAENVAQCIERKQVEESLRKSATRYRVLTEVSPQIVWLGTADGQMVYFNHKWYEYTQLSKEHSLGDGWLQVIHPDHRQRMQDVWIEAVQTHQPYEMEVPIRQGIENQYRWYLVRGLSVRNAMGKVVQWIGVATDIHDRKLAEEAVRDAARRQDKLLAIVSEREAQFRALADSIPQLAWTAQPDGAIIWFNRRWYEYTGSSPAQMQGWGWQAMVDPAEFPRILEKYRSHLESGEQWEDTFPLRRHDGEMRWHLSRALPLRDASNQIVRWFGTNTDITEERLRAESRQRHSEQLRAVAQIASQINSALDVKTVLGLVTEGARTIIRAHQAVCCMTSDLNGGTAEQVFSLSEKYADWRSRGVIPDWMGLYSLVCEPNQSIRLSQQELETHPACRDIRFDGNQFPPMRGWLAAPLVGRDGRNLGLIQLSDSVGQEFTQDDEAILVQLAQLASIAIENARLYQELREGDRLKDEFLATLAHELRNPLAPIRNALQILRIGGDSPEIFAQVREMMERQLAHMVRLVDDLLDISRITRGKIVLHPEHLDVTTVLQNAIETSRPVIEASQHELIVEVPPEPLWISGDATRLAQVISNLLNNAAKYTHERGRIWLSAARESGQAVIRVRDTGMGIPAAMLPRVFDMFTQVDRHLQRAQGGLGIGLTLVRRMVEMHGGTVEAQSEGQDQGSEFIVRLPLAEDSELSVTDQSEGPIEKALPVVAAIRRILVVDDNADSAQTLSMLLQVMGNDVQLAYDGPSALIVAEQFHPAMALLDIGLPGMNGYELARKIREIPDLKEILLVAQTGWGQDEDRRRSAEAGFDAHLVKPVDPASLQDLLQNLKPKAHRQ